MSHGYSHCPGNLKNQCVFARACPYHGDAVTCAQRVKDGTWGMSKKKLERRK